MSHRSSTRLSSGCPLKAPTLPFCRSKASSRSVHLQVERITNHSFVQGALPFISLSPAARDQGSIWHAGPNSSSSEVSSNASSSLSRGDPAPYRWSWSQDDQEPSVAVQLNSSTLAEASSITDVIAELRAAAASGPRRPALTSESRADLNRAVVRLLAQQDPATGATATITVSNAAALLTAYAVFMQGSVPVTSRDIVSQPLTAAGAASVDSCGPSTAPQPLVESVLAQVCAARTDAGAGSGPLVSSASAPELADLLWAIAELHEDLPWGLWAQAAASVPAAAAVSPQAAMDSSSASKPGQGINAGVGHAPAALQRAVLERLRNQDFLAPDLCRVACALGSLAASPSPASSSSSSGATKLPDSKGLVIDRALVSTLDEEIRYQLTEFAADFEAADLGRLIDGMSGLRLGASVTRDEEYRRVLMKAVYGKTRSLTDKAAVDFALSRLMEDDPEARSMHYDSRWTHEELHWLPRRERDKRRIIKEGWYRTQWGGWAPGGQA